MKCLLLLLLSLPSARGVLPTGVLSLDLLPQSAHEPPAFAEQLCAPSAAAGWGVSLPARYDSRWKSLVQLPAGNRDGCASYRLPSDTTTSPHGAVVVVDRGNCSFVVKAQKAQAAGAKGLIVRGTKRAVYEAVASHNSTNTSSVLSSTSEQTGAGIAVATQLQVLDKPVFEYDCSRGQAFVDELASPVWQTDAEECSADHRCASRSCVLTGRTEKHESGRKHQVCCMWDTFVLMGATNRTVTKELAIPVVYVTIANGQKLQKAMNKYPTTLVARTYRRELPLIDVSSMLLWAIGVATALGAAYYSTSSLRRRDQEIATREQQKMRDEQDSHHGEDESEGREEIWELDARHAVGFIVLAGVFLTVFYYVKIGGAIPVLFAVSGAATLTQVVTMPAVEWLMPSSSSRDVTIPLLGDTVRLSELLGFLPSCALALVWYMHRRTYWALQDIMGISLCFVFLPTVQLPNLKVATVLLSLAFCYDVFFVFLSPIFFGSSVMEDVATGGPAAYTKSGYPGVDYCERYPQYPACVDPEPMPMLLVLPRVLDWAGGVSMLGLGDIILPGMLLSFSLRFDYSQGNTNYFQFMAVGYGVGLALANIAVMVTEMGQPALMYLVPTTLGTLIAISKRNGDFRLMWAGVGADDDDTYSMKRRSSEGPGYRAVGSEEAPTGIVIGDPIGRVNDNSRGGDHVPLLSSSSS